MDNPDAQRNMQTNLKTRVIQTRVEDTGWNDQTRVSNVGLDVIQTAANCSRIPLWIRVLTRTHAHCPFSLQTGFTPGPTLGPLLLHTAAGWSRRMRRLDPSPPVCSSLLWMDSPLDLPWGISWLLFAHASPGPL